jgi:L-histidine Nalpha-methyltransferase / hercynylcysteine S-oxide synthase
MLQYTDEATYRLFTESNLRPLRCWTDPDSGYSLWLLERPPFNFRLLRTPASMLSNTPFGVPTLAEFQEMRTAWNFITTKMIPESMLFEKPIDLRHICLFYTGHIPTFLDVHLSNLLGEPYTEPESFKVHQNLIFSLATCSRLTQDIFERGIDPHVDDPTKCHVGHCGHA